MRFKVDPKTLEHCLQLIGQCVIEKPTPAPENFSRLVGAKGKKTVEVITTNNLTTLITKFTAEFTHPFDLFLPTKKLYNIVRLLTAEIQVSMNKLGTRAVIESGRFRQEIPFKTPDEMHATELAVMQPGVELQESQFNRMLECTNLATTKQDEAAWTLSCVALDVKGNELKMRACDGKQLAISKCPVENTANTELSVLIPQISISPVLKASSTNAKEKSKVTVGLAGNRLALRFARGLLLVSLIEGKFPDVEMILPKDYEHHVSFEGDDLTRSIKRVLNASLDGVIACTFTRQEMILEAQHQDLGESCESLDLPCATLNGEQLKVGINAKQALNCLSAFDGSFKMSVISPLKAVRFIPAARTKSKDYDFDFVYASMPARL